MIRIIVLTSSRRGIASRALPELHRNANIEVAAVVLAKGGSPNRKKRLTRKVRKTLKIGLLGALNGIRMRAWYADSEIDDIASVCESLGIKLMETPYISCETTKSLFRESGAELGLSLGNGYIPHSVFSIPKFGMINIHTELLPDFQGAQSIIWPIYEGRGETGFTIHQIDKHIDTGNIIYRQELEIEFMATLRDTVRENLARVRDNIPAALSHVCENYEALREEAIEQTKGKSYTTPSIWQYLRMVINHRARLRAK